jgi:hypothetical protein
MSDALASLRAMGFSNANQMIDALQRGKNDVNAAVELLITEQATQSIQTSESTTTTNASAAAHEPLRNDRPTATKKVAYVEPQQDLLSDFFESPTTSMSTTSVTLPTNVYSGGNRRQQSAEFLPIAAAGPSPLPVRRCSFQEHAHALSASSVCDMP